MPGKFRFTLVKPDLFNRDAYLHAIKETKRTKPPQDFYVSYGPEEMGTALVIKVPRHPEWALVLPSDPQKYTLECSFTYGIVSRGTLWGWLKGLLVAVCRSSPGAWEFMYEDADLGDVKEVGYFDYARDDFVITHKGLPTADDFERISSSTGLQGRPLGMLGLQGQQQQQHHQQQLQQQHHQQQQQPQQQQQQQLGRPVGTAARHKP